MKEKRFASYAFIVLWVLWVMLIVRFGFRVGLMGFEGQSGTLGTVLFVGIYCILIPVSLLAPRARNVRRLIWIAVPFCAAGIATLLLSGEAWRYAASVLLAAGSALLTSAFLFIFGYGLSKREQTIGIVAFLFAKPLFSLAALLLSAATVRLPYAALAAAVVAGIALCANWIGQPDAVARANRPAPVQAPVRSFAAVYALYALIVFERMNCVHTLFAKGAASPVPYYFYFAGGLLMSLTSYWLFGRKKIPVSIALNIFLFSAIVYLIVTVATESGLLALGNLGMAVFGISDIVYVFLFVTAASISRAHPNPKVFMGFIFVFGFALVGSFAFAHYLYVRYQTVYAVVYALASLAMIALCILTLPSLRRIENSLVFGGSGAEVKPVPAEPAAAAPQEAKADFAQLTARESEIVALYLKGYTNQQVADALCIAPATLKVHCRNIYSKLNIKSRLELHFLCATKKGGEDPASSC